MKSKKLTFLLFLTFFYLSEAFSQSKSNLSRAIVKTPFPIKSVCWNDKDTLFAYSEDNIVYVRDAFDYEIVDTIPINNVKYVSFATEGNQDVLLTLYDRGLFSIWDLRSEIPTLTESYNNNYSKINTCAFSNNSNYIATSGDDYSINLYFKLRVIRQTVQKRLSGHRTPVYSLSFSNNSSFLASASLDGRVILWNCNQNAAVSVIDEIYTRTEVPLAFSYDDKSIYCCDSASSFGVYDLSGKKIKTIKVGSTIKKIQSLYGVDVVAVSTEEGKIQLFDLKDNKYIGYIPAYNVSELTDFMFNSDNSYLLAGYNDGSVYKLNFKETLLGPGEEPPEYKVIQNNEIVVKGTNHNSNIFNKGKEYVIKFVEKDAELVEQRKEPEKKKASEEKKQDEDKKEKKEKTSTNKDKRNSIFVYGGADLLSSPFLLGPDLGAEIQFRNLIAPFYFGAGLEATIGFVNSGTFTMKYEINGILQNSPFLMGGNLYVPFGFIFPIGNGNLEMSVNLRAGARVMSITLLSQGNYMVGEPYFTFLGYVGLGFHFWNFELNAGCKYDFIGQFTPSVELGYNIRIGK